MNRRDFLGFLGAAIAGATLDPERLLWEPGKKLISIPASVAANNYGLYGNYMRIPRGLFPGKVMVGGVQR